MESDPDTHEAAKFSIDAINPHNTSQRTWVPDARALARELTSSSPFISLSPPFDAVANRNPF